MLLTLSAFKIDILPFPILHINYAIIITLLDMLLLKYKCMEKTLFHIN